MTLRISDTAMTSDQTGHTAARHAPGGQRGWEVSWLAGQVLDRDAAITAMTLAEAAAGGDVHEGHRLWPHIQAWAAELDLAGSEAIARASRQPGSTAQQEPAARHPGREAAD